MSCRWMQIGIPRIVCKYFLLMPSEHALFDKALPLIMRTPTGVAWTGCNGVWAATVHVMRGVLEQNATLVADAYSWAQETIKISPQSSVPSISRPVFVRNVGVLSNCMEINVILTSLFVLFVMLLCTLVHFFSSLIFSLPPPFLFVSFIVSSWISDAEVCCGMWLGWHNG